MAKKRQRKSNKESGTPPGRPQRDMKAERTGGPDDHFQQIPFRLREIMKSQELMNKKKIKTKPKTIKAALPKAKTEDAPVPDIPVPHFKRRKEESKRAYLQRMANETDHVFFLTQNQLERKPELEEEKQEKPANSGKSEKKMEYNKVRLQRLHQKKLNRQEKEMEKTMFIDEVKFGEVVMAPPTLSARPRKAPEKNALSKGLLLNSLLGHTMSSTAKTSKAKTQKNALSKGLLLNSLLGHTMSSTAKTSMARKRIMEEERVRVVEAYRHLKRQKQRQQELRSAGLEKLKDL